MVLEMVTFKVVGFGVGCFIVVSVGLNMTIEVKFIKIVRCY